MKFVDHGEADSFTIDRDNETFGLYGTNVTG